LRPAFAAPSPEITSLQRRPRPDAVEHGSMDELVEAIFEDRRRARLEAGAVAWKAELLDHQRFTQPLRDSDLLGDIIVAVALHGRPRAGKILRVGPAPVLRPDVGVDVIDG